MESERAKTASSKPRHTLANQAFNRNNANVFKTCKNDRMYQLVPGTLLVRSATEARFPSFPFVLSLSLLSVALPSMAFSSLPSPSFPFLFPFSLCTFSLFLSSSHGFPSPCPSALVILPFTLAFLPPFVFSFSFSLLFFFLFLPFFPILAFPSPLPFSRMRSEGFLF